MYEFRPGGLPAVAGPAVAAGAGGETTGRRVAKKKTAQTSAETLRQALIDIQSGDSTGCTKMGGCTSFLLPRRY